ncbi:MAG: hypothetical protein KY462_00610 [Actinobacteria bacterium]|nr:hypothetical protein [Actinomycetota bacterium]
MRIHTDESGLAATVLVIVIAWALAAVLMLTGTLLSARQIDDRVVTITSEVSAIDENTDAIQLTQQTIEISGNILTEVQPLSGQAGQVVTAANDIAGNLGSINSTAGEINGKVNQINASVNSIGASVRSVGASVNSIHGNVRAILATVNSIACGSNGPNPGITDLNRIRQVCGRNGVPGINNRVVEILGLVRGIKADTDAILLEVGPGHINQGLKTIHGHANSIDCSPAAPGGHCGQ